MRLTEKYLVQIGVLGFDPCPAVRISSFPIFHSLETGNCGRTKDVDPMLV